MKIKTKKKSKSKAKNSSSKKKGSSKPKKSLPKASSHLEALPGISDLTEAPSADLLGPVPEEALQAEPEPKRTLADRLMSIFGLRRSK